MQCGSEYVTGKKRNVLIHQIAVWKNQRILIFRVMNNLSQNGTFLHSNYVIACAIDAALEMIDCQAWCVLTNLKLEDDCQKERKREICYEMWREMLYDNNIREICRSNYLIQLSKCEQYNPVIFHGKKTKYAVVSVQKTACKYHQSWNELTNSDY